MTSPTKPMGIVAGEWDWMKGLPSGGNSIPFAAIMAMLNGQLGQSRGNVNLPSPGPNAPGGTITNAPAPVNPFGNLMQSLPASGWSNPNAQAWTQQALSSPYLQGWSGPSPAAGAPSSGAAPALPPGSVAPPLTSEQKKAIGKQVSGVTTAKRNGVYSGVLSGLATGGPVGAGVALATSALGNFVNTGGWFDSGIDGAWAKKTMMEHGWYPGPRGTYRRPASPDGKLNGKWAETIGGAKAVAELASLIQQYGLTPKKA